MIAYDRIGASLLSLVLAGTLAACGAQTETAQTGQADQAQEAVQPDQDETSEAAEDQAPADEQDEVDMADEAQDTPADDAARSEEATDGTDAEQQAGYVFEAGTYRMVSLNGKDTQAAIDEYLNSGYSVAVYQLVLFEDGGGFLYTGRDFNGVTYSEDGLSIDGTAASVEASDGTLTVVCGSDTLVFEAQAGAAPERIADQRLAGRYDQHDEDGAVLDRLRLNEDGTGRYRRAGAKRNTPVFWGTEQVFGTDFIMLDGVAYDVEFRRDASTGRYDVIIANDRRTRLSSVEQ